MWVQTITCKHLCDIFYQEGMHSLALTEFCRPLDCRGKYSTACLRVQRPLPNARLRLFTFPYACGSFSSLLQCVKHLPEDVEVWLFEYPGHGSRHGEPPAESMAQIVDEEVRASSCCSDAICSSSLSRSPASAHFDGQHSYCSHARVGP